MSAARTRADLFREYARVIEMCDGTKVDPIACVRINGRVNKLEAPWFTAASDLYTFAIAIVEDRPVFEDDELWHNVCGKVRVKGIGTAAGDMEMYCAPDNADCFSWNPPKPKTVTFKMEAYPAPISIAGYAKSKLKEGDRDKYDLVLTFDSIEARDTWKRALEYACHEGSN